MIIRTHGMENDEMCPNCGNEPCTCETDDIGEDMGGDMEE